jgi:hypothetical protein
MTKQATVASVIGAGLMLATTVFADPTTPPIGRWAAVWSAPALGL